MAKTKQSPESISKTEAIRNAVANLGATATLKDIHDFASKEYGLDISPSHISKIRSELSGKPQGSTKAETTRVAPTAAAEGMSKTDAVRQALSKLGKKATPTAIHDHVLNEFGIEIGLGHISNIKSTLKSKKGKRKSSERAAKAEPALT